MMLTEGVNEEAEDWSAELTARLGSGWPSVVSSSRHEKHTHRLSINTNENSGGRDSER
jgi:hypothetical protein